MNKPFTAGDLCTRTVVLSDRGMPIAEAARLMRTQHVGTLVVVEKPVADRILVAGIVTDRDIVTGIVAAGRDPGAFRVGDIMAPDVLTVRESDTLSDVLAVMRHRRVRRVPVTGPQGELVGILSVDDIQPVIAQQMRALSEVLEAAGRHEL